MSHEIFEQAKPILKKIQNKGFKAYFVGGSVRDYIMQRPIHDVDITTSATPDEIESIFDKTIPVGKEHGTINVVFQNDNYEITTFRSEDEYIDHRRPSEVYFVRDLYQDVQRRDFTMNAIAMDLNYRLYDYFNGQQDINNRVIRTVGVPSERFSEDALRIIRGLRFQSQLNFQIDSDTLHAMSSQISDIQYLSVERVVVELKKLIMGNNVKQSFEVMQNMKAFNYIPFFKSFEMSHLHIDEPITFELWIAILIVQQPKDIQLSTLKISNQEKTTIKKWVTLIQTLPKIQSKQSLIALVYDYNLNDIEILLSLHHLLKQNGLTTANHLIINEISIREANEKLPIHCRKELAINGKDLLDHTNKNSGPWLKDTLREIEIAVISNQIANTKEEILEWVDAHVKI